MDAGSPVANNTPSDSVVSLLPTGHQYFVFLIFDKLFCLAKELRFSKGSFMYCIIPALFQ